MRTLLHPFAWQTPLYTRSFEPSRPPHQAQSKEIYILYCLRRRKSALEVAHKLALGDKEYIYIYRLLTMVKVMIMEDTKKNAEGNKNWPVLP